MVPGPIEMAVACLVAWPVGEMWQQGIISRLAIPTCAFQHLTHANVDQFLDEVPPDILAVLQEHVSHSPADDDDEAWEQLVTIEGANYHPRITPEDMRRASAERRRINREGVRIFREAVAKRIA
jgi:hypothetical protein